MIRIDDTRVATLFRCRLLVVLCTALCSPPLLAGPLLTPHSAVYEVRVSLVGGQLKTRLEATADGYLATHVIKPTGISGLVASGRIRETSEFHLAQDGVRPSEYSTRDTLTPERTKASIQFDWDSGEARGTVNGENVVSVMNAIAHDHVSIQYQLMHDLLQGDPDTQYTMFEIDRLRTVNVRIIGSKKVDVPAGTYEAIGIQHQAEGSKRVTTLWCVEELGYLPVVIEQHRKGELRVRATLSRYSPRAGSSLVGSTQ